MKELFEIELRITVVSAAMLLALISDLRTCKIKNSITYSFMAAGLAVNLRFEGLRGILFSVQGIILPLLCLIALYMMRMIGAGDIKLFSAVGAVMGAGFTLHAAAYSFICGGVIASLLILTKHNGKERFKYLLAYIKCCFISMKPLQYTDFDDKQDGSKFHFSVAAFLGTATAFLLKTPMF